MVTSHGDFTGRRYSDDELRRIFAEAAAAEVRRPSSSGGHSIEEIRQIAREVGIDPAEVDRAAAHLLADQEPDAPAASPAGLTRTLHEEAVLARPLSVVEMRMVAMQAERVLGRRGILREAADVVEWRDARNALYVGIVRGRDRTRIRVIADQTGELLAGSGLIALLGLLVLPAAAELGEAAGIVLVVAAIFGLIRGYWRWRNGVTRGHLREMLDILVDSLRP